MSRAEPLVVAKQLLESRYPDHLCAFVSGSIVRGEGTRFSDIDLVLIFERLPNAFRESLFFEGYPIEVLAHDPETLRAFFDDERGGRPSLPNMVNEGLLIPPDHPKGLAMKKWAREILEAGPLELSQEQIDNHRYALTDLVDDLREPRHRGEALGTASALFEALGNFQLRRLGQWPVSPKYVVKALRTADPAIARRFEDAFEALYRRDEVAPLVSLVEEWLKPVGGFYFDGYRRDAPKERRKPVTFEKV